MDPDRFDTLIRSLTARGSRRLVTRVLLGLGVAAATRVRPVPEAEARKCPPCRKRKRGTCQGKKRDGTPCPDGTCRNGRCRPPTCADGVRNGTESDVDCGGSCPRCADGKTCAGRADCLSARCDAGRCQTCAIDADCGSDANGPCVCDVTANGGRACGSSLSGRRVDTCADCLPTEHCYDPGSPTRCYLDCGQTP
jgi:hypothetical protein